jgi:hypothetical protein
VVLSTIHNTYYYPYCICNDLDHNHTRHDEAMAATEEVRVKMVRYECMECQVTATCVDNEHARRAWRDHMLTHARFLRYRQWRFVTSV